MVILGHVAASQILINNNAVTSSSIILLFKQYFQNFQKNMIKMENKLGLSLAKLKFS